MAIKIGHASAGSGTGTRVSGDPAGDQTGREVCTRTWYKSPWDTVLRFKDPAKAEKAAKACEAGCANNAIGYDQGNRNDAEAKAKAKEVNWDLSKIKTPTEVDCSSFMTLCAQCAGIDVPYVYGNAPYTGNMVQQFTKTGEFEVLTDKKYLDSDAYLKRGDILLNTKSHTAMALENGSQGSNASTTKTPENKKSVKSVSITVRQLEKGCEGEDVRALQILLNANGCNCGDADGDFGSKTDAAVREYQRKKKLTVDGEVGKNTWTALTSK